MKREELLKSKEFWIIKIQNQLYEELEKYLSENNISQTEFAEKMGVSKGYISQILNGDFDHKLSKFVELSLIMDKVPMLRFENINKCLRIDKEIGIEKINEKMSLNIHINIDYNNKMIIDNKTKSLVKDLYLPQSGTIGFDQLKQQNYSYNKKSILN